MYSCPRCHHELVQNADDQGLYWTCESCHGRAMNFSVLRKHVGEKCMADIWRQAYPADNRDGCACPVCSRPMALETVTINGDEMAIDLCRPCEFVWLDAGEFESLPEAPPAPHVLGEIDYKNIPMELREKLAMMKVEEIRKRAQAEDPVPDEAWKAAPAALGLPIEMDSEDSGGVPWITYSMSALIVAVSVAAFFDLERIVNAFGLIPAQAGRLDGLTWITSFYLHAGVWHLVGNVYFLLLFGRAVENKIGALRWLILLFAAALFGDLLHVCGNLHSTLPCIGASGGISGVITYYALQFPKARLGMLMTYGYVYFRWLVFPAWVALLCWVLLQMLTVWEQEMGYSHVAALAHLGGFAVGAAFWAVWRKRDRSTPEVAARNPLPVKIQ